MFNITETTYTVKEVKGAFSSPAALADMEDFAAVLAGPVGSPTPEDLEEIAAFLEGAALRHHLSLSPADAASLDWMAYLWALQAVELPRVLVMRLIRGGFPGDSVLCSTSEAGLKFGASGRSLLQFLGEVPPECVAPDDSAAPVIH